ncbi:MAG: relaxase/mobilization nuclease domain-containing protein [Pseudomonadota bacterium]
MIPRVPRTKGKGLGTSFKGTAAYLLHDKDQADSADRVLWTETRNLASDDPDQAWRIMAATAMDADRLKRSHHEAEQAKLPEDERSDYRASKPSKNHVFHYSLSWDGKTEGPTLTREEMLRATYGSLRALGADHLQAMIVCHEAETNPHVHVMVNRINQETGRAEKPESNAKYRLSEWALNYERDRGYVLCKERERNAALRENNLPYDQHREEMPDAYRDAQSVAADIARDPEGADTLRQAQMEADRTLGRDTREMRDRHQGQWDALLKDHRFRKAMINQEADEGKAYADRAIRKSYVGRFDDLRDQHDAQEAAFIEREAGFFGKLKNVGTAVRHVWATRGEEDGHVLGDTFDVMANSGARLEALKKAQGAAHKSLNTAMQREIDAAIHALEGQRSAAIHGNYERFTQAKTDLEFTQAGEKAADRAAWEQRDAERLRAWQDFGARTRLEQDFKNAAAIEEARKTRASDSRQATQDPSQAFAVKAQATPEQTPAPEPQPEQSRDAGRSRERNIDDS